MLKIKSHVTGADLIKMGFAQWGDTYIYSDNISIPEEKTRIGLDMDMETFFNPNTFAIHPIVLLMIQKGMVDNSAMIFWEAVPHLTRKQRKQALALYPPETIKACRLFVKVNANYIY